MIQTLKKFGWVGALALVCGAFGLALIAWATLDPNANRILCHGGDCRDMYVRTW